MPTEEAIESGQKIKHAIQDRWQPPGYYYHLREGGHVKALQSHVHNSSFIHLDIRNFFGSINRTRVTRCLKGFFGYSVARQMANESTVFHPDEKTRQTILPFGFVQSPIVASLCLYQSALGKCLHRFRQSKRYTVSVYVDDIVISAEDDSLTAMALDELQVSAGRAGFELNTDKQEGPAEEITAFNIRLSHSGLFVEPERLAKFAAAYKNSLSCFQQNGILGYIESVNVKQACELLAKL